MLDLTHVREVISPHLPPPVLALIRNIDSNPLINEYILPQEDEPSMTILVAIVSIYIVYTTTKFIFSTMLGGGKVFQEGAGAGLDDDAPEGNVLSNILDKTNDKHNNSYRDSVILFGPCGGGKSVLFHQLVKNRTTRVVPTVTSLKANVEILEGDDGSDGDGIRIVDYPGHVTLSTKLSTLLLPDRKRGGSIRAVLVVDSTKPISEAGSLLYHSVLTNPSFVDAWKKDSNTNNTNDKIHIMVVCNKSDESGSKNWRRVKIQLRSELDKLKKISSSVHTGGSDNIHMGGDDDSDSNRITLSGKSIDLDNLSNNGVDNVKLSFMSLSCANGKGMDELKAFVKSGEVLTDNSSILKGRR